MEVINTNSVISSR